MYNHKQAAVVAAVVVRLYTTRVNKAGADRLQEQEDNLKGARRRSGTNERNSDIH